MSGGGGGQTVQQTSNRPPEEFVRAFDETYGRAKEVAAQPYQPYPGNTVAPFSPGQNAGFEAVQNAQGIAYPFINSAADYFGNALDTAQPYMDAARGVYGIAGNPFAGGSYQATPFSADEIRKYENPYIQDVVNATANLFNEQNAQQANSLRGNAVSAGAFGGDREAVQQGILAGQQKLAQDPVLAGLRQQGYQQAADMFTRQQQANLSAAALRQQADAASRQYGLAGAQGLQALGNMSLGAGLQVGQGLAGLGQQAQNSAYADANALLGIGGLQQQQAQAMLNVPYQIWQGALGYPFQTTGWLSNIAQGLGGASGGTSTTSAPGPSALSQIAGAGLAGAGLLGQTGAFGDKGWLTNAFSSNSLPNYGVPSVGDAGGIWDTTGQVGTSIFDARGGSIPERRASGGGIMSGLGSAPYGFGIPDLDDPVVLVQNVPGAQSLMNRNWGSTSTGHGPDTTGQDVMKGISTAASIVGLVAALERGGHVPGFADGGSPSGIAFFPALRSRPMIPQIDIPRVPMTAAFPGAVPPEGQFLLPAAASSVPSVQNYLTGVLSGAHFGRPQTFTPSAAPATPESRAAAALNALFGGGFDGGGSSESGGGGANGTSAAGGVGASHDMGSTEQAAAEAAAEAGAGGGSGPAGNDGLGGLYRRGGHVRRAEGGLLGDDEQDDARFSRWQDDAPQLGADAGEMPIIADVDTGSDAAPSGIAAAPAAPETATPATEEPAGIAAVFAPASAVDTTTVPTYEGAPTSGIANAASSGTDPWTTLLYTGLGIMGGASPHPGVNIGRGALAGLKQVESERTRRDLARYRADSLAALMGSRQAAQRTRDRQADLNEDKFDWKREQDRLTQQFKQRGLSDRDAQNKAMNQIRLMRLGIEGQKVELGKERNAISAGRALDASIDRDVRNQQREQTLQLRRDALDATIKQRGIANDRNASKDAQDQIGRMSSEALRIYLGSKDPITGKFNLTLEQAQKQAESVRGRATDRVGPPARQQSAAPQPAPPVGTIQDGYRYNGGPANQPSSWTKVE